MRTSIRTCLVALTLASLAACDCGGGGGDDAGAEDAGTNIGGSDSGTQDAGSTDAGTTDGGSTDAGTTDAGSTDAGTTDAGSADAGSTDAGMDGGVLLDDAGCPIPSGYVADRADAGLPAGIVLWLRGDIGVATFDGGSVCRWEDVSGNGRHVSPGTTTYPRFASAGVAGRPAVVFSNDSWLLRNDVLGLAPNQGRAIASRSQVADLTRRFATFIQGNAANNWEYIELEQNTFNTSGSRAGVYVTANAYDSDLATSTAARTHVYSLTTMDAGTVVPGTVISYAVDGVERTLTRTPGSNGPSGPGNNLIWPFTGANYTWIGFSLAAGFTGGAVAEVIVFDHALSTVERAAVEQHLGR